MPSTERWTTSITRVADSSIEYRGYPIEQLMLEWSVPAVAWLLLIGAPPTEAQEEALRRSLIAAADHGLAAPSIVVARVCASTRGAPGAAIAAGLTAFAGPAHGGAAQAAGDLLQEMVAGGSVQEAIDARLSRGERIPGYGHPYHSADPRVQPLLNTPGLPSEAHRQAARQVEERLATVVGRRLAMNGDVALAALLLDAGMTPTHIALVGTVGRCFGLAAHVAEEVLNERPFRAPSLDAIDFVESQEPIT